MIGFSSVFLAKAEYDHENVAMHIVEKTARGHRYLYLAQSVRENGRVRQKLLQPLGRKDQLEAS
ncbi:hypothetical protein, partial [Novosphingobium mathurense]|uniref:hypothetical protein n=1 Tax=Novosphingobium mathurense TaxID=428990 RepID=UPI001590285D